MGDQLVPEAKRPRLSEPADAPGLAAAVACAPVADMMQLLAGFQNGTEQVRAHVNSNDRRIALLAQLYDCCRQLAPNDPVGRVFTEIVLARTSATSR